MCGNREREDGKGEEEFRELEEEYAPVVRKCIAFVAPVCGYSGDNLSRSALIYRSSFYARPFGRICQC